MMNEKLYCASVGLVISFIAMLLLLNSPCHYVPETFVLFFSGLILGGISKEDEDVFMLAMTLPIVILFALGGLLIPVCLLLVAFYYSGLFLAIGGEAYE